MGVSNHKNIERVCVVDTIYTLFLYLLISTADEIKKTFVFFSSGIPEEIRKNFEDNSYYFDGKYKSYRRFCRNLIFTAKWKWPFLRNKNLTYWGQSHMFFSSGIIQNNKFNIVEDGLANYKRYEVRKRHSCRWLREKMYGPLYFKEEVWGMHKNCNAIYLTGLMKVDDSIKEKVILVDINQLWKEADIEKRNIIYRLFNVEENDVQFFDADSVLLVTQCFSEDNLCSEEAKIKMYQDIVKNYCGNKRLIIKVHPREKTDYSAIFPEAEIYKKKIPIELLMLIGAKIQSVVTVSSSFSYALPKHINSVVLGEDYFKQVL